MKNLFTSPKTRNSATSISDKNVISDIISDDFQSLFQKSLKHRVSNNNINFEEARNVKNINKESLLRFYRVIYSPIPILLLVLSHFLHIPFGFQILGLAFFIFVLFLSTYLTVSELIDKADSCYDHTLEEYNKLIRDSNIFRFYIKCQKLCDKLYTTIIKTRLAKFDVTSREHVQSVVNYITEDPILKAENLEAMIAASISKIDSSLRSLQKLKEKTSSASSSGTSLIKYTATDLDKVIKSLKANKAKLVTQQEDIGATVTELKDTRISLNTQYALSYEIDEIVKATQIVGLTSNLIETNELFITTLRESSQLALTKLSAISQNISTFDVSQIETLSLTAGK